MTSVIREGASKPPLQYLDFIILSWRKAAYALIRSTKYVSWHYKYNPPPLPDARQALTLGISTSGVLLLTPTVPKW